MFRHYNDVRKLAIWTDGRKIRGCALRIWINSIEKARSTIGSDKSGLGLLFRHLRNEPGHYRDEDDRQERDDRHDPSGSRAGRFRFAGFGQSFGKTPSIRVEAQDASGARRRAVVCRRRGCGAALLSKPERSAFDRLEKTPSPAPRFFVSLYSHLIFRKKK